LVWTPVTLTKPCFKADLRVRNWHFVRNAQNVKVLPVCAIKDCVIGLKLSSTAFKPQSSDHADGEYHFDKKGLLMPYTG
jgi:hypothetical protein